jgi:hypothetical protein
MRYTETILTKAEVGPITAETNKVKTPVVEAERVSQSLVRVSSLVPVVGSKDSKRSLEDLLRLIRETHNDTIELGGEVRYMASVVIKAAVVCGGFLREVKAKMRKESPGQFEKRVKNECGVAPRTNYNYRCLHKWVGSHQREILKTKPTSLRQMYILAKILPEDETRNMPKENHDELAPLRRKVAKVLTEAAKYRDFGKGKDLWKALKPLAPLLREVCTDLAENRKHVSDFGR